MLTGYGPQQARRLAEVLLDDPGLRRRWAHTLGVAARAGELARLLGLSGDDGEVLVAAAWLHDVGYGPVAAGQPPFHPLDGARLLRRLGLEERVVRLVAHHSGAEVEAAVRGRLAELAEFSPAGGVLADALTCADMQVSPVGEVVAVQGRIAEILVRYRPGDPVHVSVSRSAPALVAAVARTEARIRRRSRPQTTTGVSRTGRLTRLI